MKNFEEYFAGFYTETTQGGTIRYFYRDPYSGIVDELDEYQYYEKMETVLKGADLLEKIGLN